MLARVGLIHGADLATAVRYVCRASKDVLCRAFILTCTLNFATPRTTTAATLHIDITANITTANRITGKIPTSLLCCTTARPHPVSIATSDIAPNTMYRPPIDTPVHRHNAFKTVQTAAYADGCATQNSWLASLSIGTSLSALAAGTLLLLRRRWLHHNPLMCGWCFCALYLVTKVFKHICKIRADPSEAADEHSDLGR